MCFSATASFTASAVLAVVGLFTIKKTTTKNELPFASVPLLFSAQQFIEGLLWLGLRGEASNSLHFLVQFYTVFVGVLWPILIPLSLRLIEPVRWRKNAMLAIIILGIGIAIFTADKLLQFPMTARISDYCIAYEYPLIQPQFLLLLYVIATCGAFFLASNNLIRWLGIINILAFFVTYYFYNYNLTSVWCFFAAIISCLIYLYFSRQNQTKPAGSLSTHSSPTL